MIGKIQTADLIDGLWVARDLTDAELAEMFPPPATVEEWREIASLPRADFLEQCVIAGIITEAVAVEAASGKWPAQFDAFISGLPRKTRLDAIATWADARNGEVRRNNPVLALIAANQIAGSEEERNVVLDSMFGWTG